MIMITGHNFFSITIIIMITRFQKYDYDYDYDYNVIDKKSYSTIMIIIDSNPGAGPLVDPAAAGPLIDAK